MRESGFVARPDADRAFARTEPDGAGLQGREGPRVTAIRSLTALRGAAAPWMFGFDVRMLDHPSPAPVYAGTPAVAVVEHGWTGVDPFFILSGFILATVHPSLSVADATRFFIRRAFRLYPLHLATNLALAAGAAAGLPGLVPPWAALLIGALSRERGAVARTLNAAPLIWLGGVFFSFYLLHLPVPAVAERLLPSRGLPLPPLAGAALRDATALGLALALSALAYRLVEEPGRRLPRRRGLLSPRPNPA
jgi:peptidoglycan/LPS O-acetylase OafA/YrhL